MRLLKGLGLLVAVLFAALAIVFVAARFSDGPLAIIPGGPLASGELVMAPVADWGFAEAVETIELQLKGESTSRTVWILVREGRAFIPCSLGFPPGKNWHTRADQNGAAVIRVLGKRYPVTLTRIESPPLEANLKTVASAKYSGAPPSDSGVWFFTIESGSW